VHREQRFRSFRGATLGAHVLISRPLALQTNQQFHDLFTGFHDQTTGHPLSNHQKIELLLGAEPVAGFSTLA
jgi:hypothetical protein